MFFSIYLLRFFLLDNVPWSRMKCLQNRISLPIILLAIERNYVSMDEEEQVDRFEI